MPITIFYAWQADLDERINRYFIRDATSRAIAKLSADATVTDAPQLDHDTRGVSGTPDVFRTILEKIDSCAIFLADVTPVAKHASVSGETKQTPNANVLLELGYALARVTDRRILSVFNEAFGSPREAPFDWSRRRWPLSYNLSADSPDRKRHLEELASDIAGAIQSVLNSGPVTNLDPTLRRRLE